MALRLSSSLLSLDIAAKDYRDAATSLRNLLLTVEELRIDADLAKSGLPDISGPLSALAKMQRYDACKGLIAAFEEYVEAQVNLHLATSRHEYTQVVEPNTDPEYLREEDRG